MKKVWKKGDLAYIPAETTVTNDYRDYEKVLVPSIGVILDNHYDAPVRLVYIRGLGKRKVYHTNIYKLQGGRDEQIHGASAV